jgi:hypothetical protein
MKTYTKQNSQLLIKHCINAYSAGGKDKTQKQFSKDYLIPEARISESKRGKGGISNDKLMTLEEEYGFPRRGTGHYVQAEVYSTLDEFLNNFNAIANKRHHNHMEQLCKTSKFKDIILDLFHSKEGNSHTGLANSKELTLQNLDNLLNSEELGEWYVCELASISNGRNQPEIKYISTLLFEHNLCASPLNLEIRVARVLFRLAHYKYNIAPDFSLAKKADLEEIQSSELVVCGDIIIDEIVHADCFLKKSKQETDIDYFKTLEKVQLPDYAIGIESSTYDHNTSSYDNWQRIKLRIILTASLKYHLVIDFLDEGSFSSSGSNRSVIIEDFGKSNVLSELKRIIETFGLDTIDIENIKSNLALLGASIPGARVLD